MTEPVNLNAHRARAAHDSRLWSPLEALKDAVAKIESGELKPDMIYIAMRECDDEANLANWPATIAGATNIETVGLLTMHLHRMVNDDE